MRFVFITTTLALIIITIVCYFHYSIKKCLGTQYRKLIYLIDFLVLCSLVFVPISRFLGEFYQSPVFIAFSTLIFMIMGWAGFLIIFFILKDISKMSYIFSTLHFSLPHPKNLPFGKSLSTIIFEKDCVLGACWNRCCCKWHWFLPGPKTSTQNRGG